MKGFANLVPRFSRSVGTGRREPREGPQWVFRDPGFPLFEARDSGFESKIGASFGI